MVDVCSQLRGINGLEGSYFSFYHKPASHFFGVQSGVGANNKNLNEGLSGWFTYRGYYNGQLVEGNGDINVDKGMLALKSTLLCPNDTEFTMFWDFEDGCGNLVV